MRNTTKKATVRLSDIAKETGYSLSTVSKALNGEYGGYRKILIKLEDGE